jgi:hypothetical protein
MSERTPATPTWESILWAPAPLQHVVQLYTKPDFLVRAVTEYAGEGLRGGEALLLVATAAHVRAIARRLEGEGFALADLAHRGQLFVLDAAQALHEVLVDGLPDRARFRAVIGGAVEAANAAGDRKVRAFDEMVDLLRRTSLTAALYLEGLWSDLLAEQGVALLCGYSIDNFDPDIYDGLLQRVISAHSHLVPVEDYARLDQAVELAYAEIFGSGRDAGYLRRAFLAHYVRSASMPDAEAAILAAREFVPAAAADALLDRTRYYYRIFTAAVA